MSRMRGEQETLRWIAKHRENELPRRERIDPSTKEAKQKNVCGSHTFF